MTGQPIAYAVRKTPEIWAALARGFGARVAPLPFNEPRSLELAGPAILGGLQFDMPSLLGSARLMNHPYIFVDNGYFATHHEGRRIRYRIVPDAYCHHWINEHRRFDGRRLASLGLELKPWRQKSKNGAGRHILIYTSSPAHAAFFGLSTWVEDTIATLGKSTDRPIVVRRKGELGPLEQELKDCWAVVTWSSKLACEAALEGVPVFTSDESGAAPVSAGILEHIERPSLCDFRYDWARALAWGQFTIDEIASGLAAAAAREAAASRQSLYRAQAHA